MLFSTPLHNLVLYFGETCLVVRIGFKLGGGGGGGEQLELYT